MMQLKTQIFNHILTNNAYLITKMMCNNMNTFNLLKQMLQIGVADAIKQGYTILSMKDVWKTNTPKQSCVFDAPHRMTEQILYTIPRTKIKHGRWRPCPDGQSTKNYFVFSFSFFKVEGNTYFLVVNNDCIIYFIIFFLPCIPFNYRGGSEKINSLGSTVVVRLNTENKQQVKNLIV